MGGAQSSPIPGGGTEGYHVLRVWTIKNLFELLQRNDVIDLCGACYPAAVVFCWFSSCCEVKSNRHLHSPLICRRVLILPLVSDSPKRSNGLKSGPFAAQQDQSSKRPPAPSHYSLGIIKHQLKHSSEI